MASILFIIAHPPRVLRPVSRKYLHELRTLSRQCALAVLAYIEAVLYLVRGYPQPQEHVQHLGDSKRQTERENYDYRHRSELYEELLWVAVEQAVCARFVDRGGREQSRGQRAPGSPNTVTGQHVKRLVEARFLPELDGVVTKTCGDAANYDRGPWLHESRSRCNGHQSHHRARYDAEDARFVVAPAQQHPYQSGGCG